MWMVGMLLVTGVVAGCAQQVQGNALGDPDAVRSTSTGSATTTKPTDDDPLGGPLASGAPAMEQKLCDLLTFDDLPFKNQGDNATNPQAQKNISADFDQSCRWTYEIKQPKMKVGSQLYYRKTRDLTVKDPTGSYTIKDRQVSYQQAENNSCVLSMKYADGHVGIGVIDGSNLFGPQCELGKKIAETILSREPAALS
jgi:hypothetical protein